MKGNMLDLLAANTGTPQGYVLSPLFIYYTDNCRFCKEGSNLVKFSDDIALFALLQGSESDHGGAQPALLDWHDYSFLDRHVSKMKELLVDFKKNEKA